MVSLYLTISAKTALLPVFGNSIDPEFIIGNLEKIACPYLVVLPDSFSYLYLKKERSIFLWG